MIVSANISVGKNSGLVVEQDVQHTIYRKQNLTPACSIHILSNLINAIPGFQYLLSL